MKFSIFDGKTYFNNNHDIYWQIQKPIKDFFIDYKNNYKIKCEIKLLEYDYFDILCDLFWEKQKSISEFINLNLLEEIKVNIYNKLCKIISNEKAIEFSENIYIYLNKNKDTNIKIFTEFESFIQYFFNYIKKILYNEYIAFKEINNILLNDCLFFKKNEIKSLKKYNFIFGKYLEKYSESRFNYTFNPAGLCYYGSRIFINSLNSLSLRKYGKLWFSRSVKKAFYHEIGHALDYLFFNENILKSEKLDRFSSYNKKFLKLCIKNNKKLKYLSIKLPKKTKTYLNYFSKPKNILPNNTNCTKNIYINYKRVLNETWSENFSYIFNWLKNGFSEYDKFTIRNKNSSDRIFIKINYHTLIYILKNINWEKLNISYNIYMKRKIQIQKYLNYVNISELTSPSKNLKFIERNKKKFITFRDILEK